MKEIGGFFGLEQTHGNKEHYPNLIALNTARNALVYLIKSRKIKKIYIPYYLCDSVSNVCEREGLQYEFYHIDDSFLPIFNKKLQKNEFLYLVNYYGQIDNYQLSNLYQKYKRIIIDNVQAFFQKPIPNVDTIYSCRKFFGVPDGAYLSTDCILKENLETDCSDSRTKHIYGRIADGAAAHYQEFKENDFSFKTLPLKKMSFLTHNLLKNINYNYVKKKRTTNFAYLHSVLDKYNGFRVHCVEGPYAYPFFIENASFLRKILIEKKIYIPVLWPNVVGVPEEAFAMNILPIPCDQRYGKKEMDIMINEIITFIQSRNC